MGEIAEMMLDGTLCAGCGEFLGEDDDGIPAYCAGCAPEYEDEDASDYKPGMFCDPAPLPKPFKCDCCNRKFKTEIGRADHKAAMHTEEKP